MSETFTLTTGVRAFSLPHTYLDDDPTNTLSDTYTVTVTVDDGIALDNAIALVAVNNVAPTVDAGADQAAIVGDTVSFTATFTDSGTLDSHTTLWDFGDGSGVVTGTLIPTHTYTGTGVYTVTLTVTDDDAGVGIDTLVVTVSRLFIYLPIVTR